MQTGFRLFSFRTVPLFAFLATFCLVRPASADFLYDIQTNAFGAATHERFTEPAILTSTTTVTSFLLNTSTGLAVTRATLDPVSSGSCTVGGFSISGPCLALTFANGGTGFFSNFPVYTSVGTYSNGGTATITISPFVASTPEPSSILLLMTMLGGGVLAFKKRLRTRSSPLPAAVG